jgi:hypothetical protein
MDGWMYIQDMSRVGAASKDKKKKSPKAMQYSEGEEDGEDEEEGEEEGEEEEDDEGKESKFLASAASKGAAFEWDDFGFGKVWHLLPLRAHVSFVLKGY